MKSEWESYARNRLKKHPILPAGYNKAGANTVFPKQPAPIKSINSPVKIAFPYNNKLTARRLSSTRIYLQIYIAFSAIFIFFRNLQMKS